MTSSATETSITADDGHPIQCFTWTPGTQSVRGIIQILHGLGEHASRYARFAAAAAGQGYVVIVHNHRGHGSSSEHLGHYADNNGWDKIITDVLRVQESICQQYPERPLILLGHSMGSFIAQSCVMRQAANVNALILSGSAFGSRLQLHIAKFIARLETWRHGKRAPSDLMDKLNFQTFNKHFAPARTDFDWLSRDENEVDKYVTDPLCGTVSSGQLWYDFLGGLLGIMSPRAVEKIPTDLPILICGGERDPVGGASGMGKLAAVYKDTGHSKVTVKIYADARHELLNEINRAAVTTDILDWIKAAI